MENKNEEQDVKDVDTSYIEPSTDENDELVETNENETQPLSSDGENEEEEIEEVQSDEEVEQTEEEIEEESNDTPPEEDEEKPAKGETLREYALRKELENTRKLIREQKQSELFIKNNASVKEDDILSEYDPDEVNKLEKLIGKLGYVKKNELESQTYETIANEQLSSFLDKHPEYLYDNDKTGALWNQFKEEFNLYKQPTNPKEYKRLFEKIHNDLKSSSSIDINKINASREKLKVASHSGAAIVGRKTQQPRQNISGIRTDMLKGFDEEEINELLS